VKHPVTLDGQYFVVRSRLWRMANPELDEAQRSDLVCRLMKARRAVRDARRINDQKAEAVARKAVDLVKRVSNVPVRPEACTTASEEVDNVGDNLRREARH
jgi:hypothetical protein